MIAGEGIAVADIKRMDMKRAVMMRRGVGVSALLFLAGCAPKVHFPAGEALLRGEQPAVAAVAPESLRADIDLIGYQGRNRTSVSAALSAIPGRKYKLDVYGLPGMVEAGFLWTDTGWTLVIYGREGYLQGYGDTVDLPALGVSAAPVHDIFASLWGDYFPGDSTPEDSAPAGAGDSAATAGGKVRLLPARWEKAGDGLIRYPGRDLPWVARLDARTGVVLEAVRADSGFRVVYEGYTLRRGRLAPKRVKIFARDRPLLEIGVESVEDNPDWLRDPFRLRIPKGFERLRAVRKP